MVVRSSFYFTFEIYILIKLSCFGFEYLYSRTCKGKYKYTFLCYSPENPQQNLPYPPSPPHKTEGNWKCYYSTLTATWCMLVTWFELSNYMDFLYLRVMNELHVCGCHWLSWQAISLYEHKSKNIKADVWSPYHKILSNMQ